MRKQFSYLQIGSYFCLSLGKEKTLFIGLIDNAFFTFDPLDDVFSL